MRSQSVNPNDFDEYNAGFPPNVQKILHLIRLTIKKVAPDATEAISYQIPTFKLEGKYLIYFAAYKNHVSVYPAPREANEFKEELAAYKRRQRHRAVSLESAYPIRPDRQNC